MSKLSLDALEVSSFSTGADTGDDEEQMLKNTDPRACPYTQGWNCTTIQVETDRCDYTNAQGCQTGGGYGC